MMDKLKKNMVFYLLLLIDFYIVPWFIKNTGSAMIVMLVIIPLICLITSVFYCLLYTSPSPRDGLLSRMPSSA